MPSPARKRQLGPQQRRALLFLAGIPFGATDAAISASGITRQTLARLIHAGLATAQREVKAGGRITEAGRRAPRGVTNGNPLPWSLIVDFSGNRGTSDRAGLWSGMDIACATNAHLLGQFLPLGPPSLAASFVLL
jgi:hypothetical protein